MAKVIKCPGCGESAYHDDGSYRKCSNYGYIGWGWKHIPKDVGSDHGNICIECEYMTLHDIVQKVQ